jgi:hypothetical protein
LLGRLQERVRAPLELVVLAAQRAQAAAAQIRQLRYQPFGVAGAKRQLQALRQPRQRGLVVAVVGVLQPRVVVQPHVVRRVALDLRPQRIGLLAAAGAQQELGDHRAPVGHATPAGVERALDRRDRLGVAALAAVAARQVLEHLGPIQLVGLRMRPGALDQPFGLPHVTRSQRRGQLLREPVDPLHRAPP